MPHMATSSAASHTDKYASLHALLTHNNKAVRCSTERAVRACPCMRKHSMRKHMQHAMCLGQDSV